MDWPTIDAEAFSLFDSPQTTGTPERRLLLAILERAILDYVGNDQEEVASSREWLFDRTEEPPYSQFTCAWVCEQLDLDRDKVMRTIKKMPRRGNHRVAPWYFARGHFLEEKVSAARCG